MIAVAPVPEPPQFDADVRQRGNAWLAEHPEAARPRDLWSAFRSDLAAGFGNRCGYTAMWDLVGTVDHLKSWRAHPELACEWSNYRYASAFINSAKKDHDVLDPHAVGEGWFEVLLPSMQLVVTARVPAEARALVDRTLGVLSLVNGPRVVRARVAWYGLYRDGSLPLAGLWRVAPLVAAAEEKRLTSLPAP